MKSRKNTANCIWDAQIVSYSEWLQVFCKNSLGTGQWWVPLFPAVTFSYPSILPGITCEMLTLISWSLKPPPKFLPLLSHWSCCILGCASFTDHSQTQIHPNTSETGTIHLPGNLFGFIFLSQEKGVIFAQIRAFVDLVILGPAMAECCSLNPKQEQCWHQKSISLPSP